jgi:nucleotide-binding universal stress UspA family protein
MHTNILIATDGSDLSWEAVQHGIALAKRIDAKATALTVLPPFHMFTTDTRMIEDTFIHARQAPFFEAAKPTRSGDGFHPVPRVSAVPNGLYSASKRPSLLFKRFRSVTL